MSATQQLAADTTFAAIDFESAGFDQGGTDVPVQVGTAGAQTRIRMSDPAPGQDS